MHGKKLGRLKEVKDIREYWESEPKDFTPWLIQEENLANEIGVQLIIDGDKAKAHYHLLYQDKERIEKEIRQELTWEELPEKKQSQIGIFFENCCTQEKAQWPELHKWLHDNLEALHSTFHERIKNLDASDWQSLDDLDNDDND